ncbi:cation channel sperm-associated protein 1-like isoform X2 [Tenebrio molitor]|uniref:cation channel sperm-associated protein 1-like isoform X2 n=1 Tax=Tenebrio molitor TaxID=7067 RepID=UPI0036248EC9
MASLTLITPFLCAGVLTLLTGTCFCEISSYPYTEATFAKSPGHGSVIYVPAHIGNLPLQEHGQIYPPHLNLGQHYQQQYQHLSQGSAASHLGGGPGQGYHHQGDVSGDKHHAGSGSATVYQQANHHSSEQKHSIHHHGSGVSHQVFKQEHPASHEDHSSQGHDYEIEKSEELHHKKDHNVHYQYEYSVQDHKTGDVKRHREERKGDVVNGEYSLLEEDGNVRTVKYFADWKSGFHAQVHNSKPKSVG